MASIESALYFEFNKNNYSSELTVICLTLLTVLVLQQSYRRWKKPFPPGPWGLPIVGYRPFMGQFPHKKFNELSKTYGPIMGVSVGSLNMVVINDFENMTEAFRKEETTARPPGTFYNYSKFGSISNMNGSIWKEHRKFFSGFLRNLFRTDDGILSLHNIFAEHTGHLLSEIGKVKKGTNVNVRELLRHGTNNTMMKVVFGVNLPDNHPFIKAMTVQQDGLLKQALPTNWTMCFPKLTWLTRNVLSEQKELRESSKLVTDFIKDQIESHKKNLDPANPRDFIDYSLLRERTIEDKTLHSDDILNNNVQMVLAGGTDTTRTSLEWSFLLMAKFPEIQDKIFVEINKVFGQDQKPRWEDRYQLPYTMAAIMECQRWQTIVPLSTLKMITEDISLNGYWIPKGTVVLGNIWAIHNDETYWDNPSEFNPEHYLTKDGKLDLNKRFVAFSNGKRDCPGKNQALMELFVFLVAVLQKFKILPSVDGVSLEQDHSLVAGPIKPFVRFEKRT